MKKQYVTAFPGRRDSYQLPIGLMEHERLAGFITCFYRGRGILGWLAARFRMGERLLSTRQADGVPADHVTCLEFANTAARAGQRFLQTSKVAVWEDVAFARKAVAVAQAKRASLLLYEFQADWAFRQQLDREAVKILFQFHPHPDLEHPLLLVDGERYPQFLAGIRRNTRSNLGHRYREHTRHAWRHADHVIVASHFSARSLQVAGCPAERISVVPYGCSFDDDNDQASRPAAPAIKPYFLFVGSGIHRKGLHHLLEAWSLSKVHATHELVVIARVVDPELRGALAAAPGVRHIAGVPQVELMQWFRGAQAFVLPSLSEGFGHVYLEALACGCPIIGTRHSMLPDFLKAQPHIRYVEPADPAGIRQEIEKIAALPTGDVFFQATSIRESVKGYTWKRFRDGIEAVLARFD